MRKSILIFCSSLVLVLFYNSTFFQKSFGVFNSYLFMFSLGVTLFLVISLLIVLLDSKWSLKPVLILFFWIASLTAYFTNSYGTIIDEKMIQNVVETDISEASGLFSFKLLLYIFLGAVLPTILIVKTKIEYLSFVKNIVFKLKWMVIILVLLVGNLLLFSKAYTSFFREYKPLRYYTIPTYPIYGAIKYIKIKYFTKEIPFTKIGTDAKLVKEGDKPKLFIFVLGEAARWDHFSLNGYKRDTNPTLSKDEDIIDFKNFYSCGTETAVSVPCMFSDLTRKNYSDKVAKHRSSLIDVLNYAGVRVLWIDNNSDSKGVAVRIKNYKNIKDSCSGECRDEEMLKGLDEFVKSKKPTFIVLHQMGSHGPEYYKRTDKKYKKFLPECKSNQLQTCSRESIVNAYDNTIVYTDSFITKTKEFLKKHLKEYDVILWYVADHGESLGEGGVYLHGLPYFIAPEAQKHPASLMWFGGESDDVAKIREIKDKKLSQDFIFSTVLRLMGVKTNVYDKKLDLLNIN